MSEANDTLDMTDADALLVLDAMQDADDPTDVERWRVALAVASDALTDRLGLDSPCE